MLRFFLDDSDILNAIAALSQQISQLENKMADLQTALNDEAKALADVSAAAASEITLVNEVLAALKALPAGTPITQAQIDTIEGASLSLETVAGNLNSASTSMQAALPPPPPAPTPAPAA